LLLLFSIFFHLQPVVEFDFMATNLNNVLDQQLGLSKWLLLLSRISTDLLWRHYHNCRLDCCNALL